MLAGIQGAIDNLRPEYQIRIAALAATDPIAALQLAVETFAAQGIEIPIELTALLDTFTGAVDTATEPRQTEVELESNAGEVGDDIDDAVEDRETGVELESNADETGDDIDDATEDRTTQVIVPKSDSLGQMQTLIDHVARARTVAFNVKADNAGAIDNVLDGVDRNPTGAYRRRRRNRRRRTRAQSHGTRPTYRTSVSHTVGSTSRAASPGTTRGVTAATLDAGAARHRST